MAPAPATTNPAAENNQVSSASPPPCVRVNVTSTSQAFLALEALPQPRVTPLCTKVPRKRKGRAHTFHRESHQSTPAVPPRNQREAPRNKEETRHQQSPTPHSFSEIVLNGAASPFVRQLMMSSYACPRHNKRMARARPKVSACGTMLAIRHKSERRHLITAAQHPRGTNVQTARGHKEQRKATWRRLHTKGSRRALPRKHLNATERLRKCTRQATHLGWNLLPPCLESGLRRHQARQAHLQQPHRLLDVTLYRCVLHKVKEACQSHGKGGVNRGKARCVNSVRRVRRDGRACDRCCSEALGFSSSCTAGFAVPVLLIDVGDATTVFNFRVQARLINSAYSHHDFKKNPAHFT